METPTGGGRDSRYMGYSMSLLSGETSPEIYGGATHSRPSTSVSSGVSRSTMSLPSTCSAGMQRGLKRPSSDVCFDPEVSAARSSMSSQSGLGMSTECGSDIGDDGFSQAQKKTPPPNGKKTKGRVKIKMEYIDNKLRRYTTFSKRKTGIMKKAYELSTLTGTQVMLLVASETGHVYTFATRKLQPMITSEAGKALIQTCLNSPDPPPTGVGGDQRMSATGFEETELTYNIGDEEQKEEGTSPQSDVGADSGDSSGMESPPPPEHVGTPDIRAGMMNPGYTGVMYQTSQGMVYATPTSALSNGVIFSLSQGQFQQLQQEAAGANRGTQSAGPQQFITIPLPVTLTASNGHPQEAADLTKARKYIIFDLFWLKLYPTVSITIKEGNASDNSFSGLNKQGYEIICDVFLIRERLSNAHKLQQLEILRNSNHIHVNDIIFHYNGKQFL
ncbi:Serum response factor-like protein, partial [Gryllus bimaculatus]